MKIRFQADANLNPRIAAGLQRREPAIDYRGATGFIADALPDSQVLSLSAQDGRVLISADLRTLPRHFVDFIAQQDSPGLILIPAATPIGDVIEGILVAWASWSEEDLRNQIRWLPR